MVVGGVGAQRVIDHCHTRRARRRPCSPEPAGSGVASGGGGAACCVPAVLVLWRGGSGGAPGPVSAGAQSQPWWKSGAETSHTATTAPDASVTDRSATISTVHSAGAVATAATVSNSVLRGT